MPVTILVSSPFASLTITLVHLSTRHDGGMSGFGGTWIAVLADAVTAGRATLRDLDSPEVPATLRRVAAYSGGKLPPPLAASLLAEIDGNEWFREKVVADWDGDEDSAVGLFLLRREGWWLELAARSAAGESGRGDERLSQLEKRVEQLDRKQKAAANKTAEYKKALREEKSRGKERIESAKRSIEAKFAAEAESLSDKVKEIGGLNERLELLQREHRQLQEAFDSLRTRLARARRSRPEAGDGTTSRFVPTDPVKLARQLDLQTASYGRTPGREEKRPEPEDTPLALGSGVRPDSSDAIRWLLELTEPVVVVVDGYNAQFHVDRADFTSGAARRHLVDALKRLREAATAAHRIVVVYDSTLPGERVARSSLGGVEIRFAEKDRIADEEIVAMVEDLGRVVAICSDREVREGAEDGGAVVLWSEALDDWLGRR